MILLVLLVVVIAGVVYSLARDDDGSAATSDNGTLTVTYLSQPGADAIKKVVACPSTDAEVQSVCDALTPELLAPTPAGQACTMIFGGPETATITGMLRGVDVDAAFSRANGCEIARWELLVKALAPLTITGL